VPRYRRFLFSLAIVLGLAPLGLEAMSYLVECQRPGPAEPLLCDPLRFKPELAALALAQALRTERQLGQSDSPLLCLIVGMWRGFKVYFLPF
jgi:hypothetical protein